MAEVSDLPGDPRVDVESLLTAAITVLRQRLPPKWAVQPFHNDLDRMQLTIADSGGMQRNFLVEARLRLNPSDAKALLGGALTRRLLRTAYHTPLIVVAPFLGPRTRQLLMVEDHNYADLTGNVHLAVEQPGIFVHTDGERRDPIRTLPATRGLRGTAAGRVARYLIETPAPCTVSHIAAGADVNTGYASRIVEYLNTEAIIDRRPRGPVTRVDADTLLRYRSEALGLDDGHMNTDDRLAWLRVNDPAWRTPAASTVTR